MSALTLTKRGMRNAVWHGTLTGVPAGSDAPIIRVTHQGQAVPDVVVERENGEGWTVQVPIPSDAIADGVQLFLVYEDGTDTPLAEFAIIAGDAEPDDLRREVELLRAELDMLKRAFRRHCLETG